MKLNVGTVDKIIRYLLGAAIIGAGLYFKNWLGLIGVVLIATALIGWCPIYLPFGISTIVKKKA
jgi:hypothetical protein